MGQSSDSQVEPLPVDTDSVKLESAISEETEFAASEKFEESVPEVLSVSNEAPADSTESAVGIDSDEIAAPVLAAEDSLPDVNSIPSDSLAGSKDENVEEPREISSANLDSENLKSAPTESPVVSPVPKLALPAQPEPDIEPSAEIQSVEKDQFVEEVCFCYDPYLQNLIAFQQPDNTQDHHVC